MRFGIANSVIFNILIEIAHIINFIFISIFDAPGKKPDFFEEYTFVDCMKLSIVILRADLLLFRYRMAEEYTRVTRVLASR